MMLGDARSLFDIPRERVWLNAAYMGPLPRRAVAAGERSYQRKAAPWDYDIATDFFGVPNDFRRAGAVFFGASEEDIAIVPAASYAIATAARNLKIEAGREILVPEGQFPSNVYPWRRMAEREGGRVRAIARRDGQSWSEALLAAIGPETGLVAAPGTHWIDGGRIDLQAIGVRTREVGAHLVLDLTQSLGVQAFDVRTVDPDFAVAANYKWLLGPYATGMAYVAPRHHSGEPLEENWIAREGSEDFARLIDYQDGYAPGARRFDMGERSNFQLLPAAIESLQMLAGFGVRAIEARLGEISDRLIEAVAPFGLAAEVPDRAAHYLALTLPDDAPRDLLARLAAQNVHVSQRGPRLRVAPHIYNDEADVERFAAALKDALA